MSYTSGSLHGCSPSVSHRLDHEVSLQGAGRRVAGADTNDYPAGVQRTGRKDRIRRVVARTCPYVRGNPAAYCRQRLRACGASRDGHRIGCRWSSRTCASATGGGISGLGATFSTTSGNITDDVILQYLQEHEPTGVSR